MKIFITLLVFSLNFIQINAQIDYEFHEKDAQDYFYELNEAYKNKESSPLKKEDLESFESLPFFPINRKFIVEARFEKFNKKAIEVFQTSTTRIPKYIVYGKLYFEIDGKELELTLYQNPDLKKNKAYKDYLFLPFTDITSGESTYGGGRYIDFRIPKSKSVILNFNKAYNPYCAYNDGYFCPIPPKNNFLDTEIKAGIMYHEEYEY